MPVNQADFLAATGPALICRSRRRSWWRPLPQAGKPLVVVLMNGSALGVNWINEHANAVLEAWYPGEEGGAAIADTLAGRTILRDGCR